MGPGNMNLHMKRGANKKIVGSMVAAMVYYVVMCSVFEEIAKDKKGRQAFKNLLNFYLSHCEGRHGQA